MSSFHNSPRVQRRRRVLVEEVRGSAQQPSTTTRTGSERRAAHRRYTESALQSMQASVSDYLPLRAWTLSVWLLSGLTLIAGLLALYSQHSQWGRTIPRADLVAFDFAARGNLVAWFSSMSLVLSAAIMLAIYSVRQHRLDDYRGRFTIWLWAAGWAAFCSLDATAGLHHAIRGICVALSGATVLGDGSIWWVFMYSVVFGFLAVRLMIEMQPSRFALASLLAAVLSYFISGLILLGLVPTLVGRLAAIAHVTSLLMGHLLLVFSLLTHARYVMMDARGETRRRQRRTVASSKKPAADETQAGEASVKTDKKAARQPEEKPQTQTESKPDVAGSKSPATASLPSTGKSTLRTVSRPERDVKDRELASSESDPEEAEATIVKMSRAERKRLRKENRRHRKAA